MSIFVLSVGRIASVWRGSDAVYRTRDVQLDFAPSPRIQITSLETRGLLVEISGPLTALDRDLEDAIVGHLNAGRRDFILRMSGVTNIDSIGLGSTYFSL